MNDTITNLTENLENLADISPETVVDGLGGALGCTSPVSKWNGNITASKNGDRFAIGQDLHFDMAGIDNEFFHIQVTVSESLFSFTSCTSELW